MKGGRSVDYDFDDGFEGYDSEETTISIADEIAGMDYPTERSGGEE